ncbi:cellulose binding domain-containing protein [Streptosporangium vulgare]|uniref:cellulose binding domain-containing protein n=1 Tax=Streptosporangium vulgare TaxID=46190 RepID=UPI003CD0AED2
MLPQARRLRDITATWRHSCPGPAARRSQRRRQRLRRLPGDDQESPPATGTSHTLTGLTPRRRTPSPWWPGRGGQLSTASRAPRSPPRRHRGRCTATYTVGSSWQAPYQGEVTVKNAGTSRRTAWTVTWRFPNGPDDQPALERHAHTDGADVSVKNLS